MTLRVQLNELGRHLRGHQEDAQERLAIGRAQRAVKELQGTVEALARLVDALSELHGSGVAVVAPPALELLPSALEEAVTAARDDGLVAGRGDEASVLRLARTLLAEVRAQVAPAWQALKQQQPPPLIDEDLIDLATEADSTLRNRYEFAMGALLPLQERSEPKEGDVQQWHSRIGELRDIARRVTEAAPSDEVRQFLTAAASREGARLDHLESPEVQAWLSESERVDRYRVVARDR
jgi:hypothetical protein